MVQSSLSSVAARIRALLAKTTEAGATEAEALAAAAKAAELMERYGIERSALELEAEGTQHTTTPFKRNWTKFHDVDVGFALLPSIAAFTSTRGWRDRQNKTYNFIGLRSDVDFAIFLHSSLSRFVIEHSKKFGFSFDDDDRRVPISLQEREFALGMITRINERLRELTLENERHGAETTDGKALVPLRRAIADRALNAIGIQLTTGRGAASTGAAQNSFAAGHAAGNAASFGRPLTSASTLRISRR